MAADVIQATQHQLVVASSDYIEHTYIGLFVNTDGTIDVVMPNGEGVETTIQYNVTAGMLLPIRPLKVTALTAQVVGLY